MILDRIEEAGRYANAHPWFEAAFRFLVRTDLASLPVGRIDLDGGRFYALVMDAEGKGRDGARLETHRKFVDIQYVVRGCDLMGWRSATEPLLGEGYDAAKDIEFHRAAPVCWLDVPGGHFAVFFPADAHAPLAGSGPVRKVVVKVPSGG
jgi:YhcH/YjgK/YiaL family protein